MNSTGVVEGCARIHESTRDCQEVGGEVVGISTGLPTVRVNRVVMRKAWKDLMTIFLIPWKIPPASCAGKDRRIIPGVYFLYLLPLEEGQGEEKNLMRMDNNNR